MDKGKFDINMGEPSTTTKPCHMHEPSTKPLRKAKYVWELKGRHHLKSNYKLLNRFTNKRNPKINKSYESIQSSNSESDSDTENKSFIGNRKSIIDGFLASNCIFDMDLVPELYNIDKSLLDDIPVTLVKVNNRTQDEYLKKWQNRQVAQSFVDNTINTILEYWQNTSFDSRELIENASELIENCENDVEVEDEGILMAIQSHGLKSSADSGFDSRCNEINPCTSNVIDTDTGTSDFDFVYQNKQPEKNDDVDFLSAAISVAIQKKGLNSGNY